jgi:hypothetical protein
MKTLSIISFNAFTKENGTEMFAIRTNQGVVYTTKEYLTKKAKNIGKTLNDILSNGKAFEINAEEVILRKEGVEFTFTDKQDVEKTYTPKSDYLEIKSYDLSLNSSGSLNQMIASATADRIADSLVGSFNFGMTSMNQNASSDSEDDQEDEEEIVVTDESQAETK